MSAEAHKFKVGLFVVGGVTIIAAALIWLGASKFLSETRKYVTYFNESVQGLDVGSTVKLMGVSVGTVLHINIAPDGKLVEVQMELQKSFQKTQDMRAELAMAGITGMKFVEITRDAEAKPVEIQFAPSADYIPAKSSSTQEIFEALGNVYEKIMQIDFEGISDETKQTLTSITKRVNDPKVDRLLEAMAGAAERLRYLLSKKQTENTIDEVEATLGELKGLVRTIREEIAGVDLQGTFAELHETVSNFNQMIERVDTEFSATLINLRNTTDNLSRITEKVRQDPAQVILGEPAPERTVAPEKEGSKMKRIATAVLILAALAALPACIKITRPYKEVTYYQIVYDSPQVNGTAFGKIVVRVPSFDVAPTFDRQRIMYSTSALKLKSYEYHLWVTNIGEMLSDLLIRDMVASHLYEAVVDMKSSINPQYELESTIEQVYEKDEGSDWYSVMRLRCVFFAYHRGKHVLFQRVYQHESQTKGREPSDIVEAMGRDSKEISASLQKDMNEAVAAYEKVKEEQAKQEKEISDPKNK